MNFKILILFLSVFFCNLSSAGNYSYSRMDDSTRTTEFYNRARSMSGVSVYFDMRCGAKYGYMGSIISPRLGNFHVFDYSYYLQHSNKKSYGYNSPIQIETSSLGIMTFEDHYCDAPYSSRLLKQP